MLRSAGRPQEAYELDKDILDKQQGALGESHPLTLQTAGSLAADLRALGKFDEALAMDEETYTQLRYAVGPDEPTTLSAANNLAVDLRLVGNFSRARVIDAETLADRQRVLGNRPSVLAALRGHARARHARAWRVPRFHRAAHHHP